MRVKKRLKAPLIFTLGTSTRTKEEFLELLRYYHIETVVDVRSFPQSRFEHFKKENLVRILVGVHRFRVHLVKFPEGNPI